VKPLIYSALAAFLVLGSAAPAASYAGTPAEDLPDIGTPAEAYLSLEDEYQIGRMIVRGLRDQGQILDDPEVSEYLHGLGYRLSAQANEGSHKFDFFTVKDTTINAFALPGGFIGVNSGLVLQTKNEDELAGVLAHEIAHVTQRHIARSIEAQSKSSLVSTAAMLAAILVGAAAGGDAGMAGVAAAQSLALHARERNRSGSSGSQHSCAGSVRSEWDAGILRDFESARGQQRDQHSGNASHAPSHDHAYCRDERTRSSNAR
jgi:predicted Zn-dependent protease